MNLSSKEDASGGNITLPKTEEYALAFVDFLGAKDLIYQDKDDSMLASFKTVCSIAVSACRKLLQEEGVGIKMFSDNIVLCKKIDINEENILRAKSQAIMQVATATAFLQYFTLKNLGLLIRGGITIGSVYIDDLMVWGTALIDAYNIENSLALYPRVVFDPVVINSPVGQAVTQRDWIVRDQDGLYYLNYIKMVWETQDQKTRKAEHKKFWISNRQQMAKNEGKHSIIAKRCWHESYLDRIDL